jgi:integrase
MALSEMQVRKAKAKDKPYMVRDDDGLYIEVAPTGNKYWRLRYWVQGKEKKVSLGVYPRVGLKEAREARDAYKKDLANGIDPRAPKKKAATFERVAREWHGKHIAGVKSDSYARDTLRRLERYLFPSLGSRPIREIAAPELLAMLRLIEEKGLFVVAHRAKQVAGQVFRYGIAIGECEHDLSADLRGALTPVDADSHRASLTRPEDIARLLRAMDDFQGSFIVKQALWFSTYSFLRPGEVRRLEWSEINFESLEIDIPKEKMKKRRPHIVPMSKQTEQILRRLKPHTGHGKYVFASIISTSGDVPIGKTTLLTALRRMGFEKDEMCAHGFRGMASTILNVQRRFSPDAIEMQLAHAPKDATRRAYNHAQYLPERQEMMQWWADWLDGLKGENP